MQTFRAESSILLTVPPARVWRALTDPADIKQYLFGTEAVSAWKIGSPLEFHGEWEGKPYLDKGTILQWVPEQLFQYDYHSSMSGTPDTPENYQLITYALRTEGGGTLLQIIQERILSEAQAQHSTQMWAEVLQRLKELLEPS